jgi:hypothetical protein
MTEEEVRRVLSGYGASDWEIEEVFYTVAGLDASGVMSIFCILPEGMAAVQFSKHRGSGLTPLHPLAHQVRWLSVTLTRPPGEFL